MLEACKALESVIEYNDDEVTESLLLGGIYLVLKDTVYLGSNMEGPLSGSGASMDGKGLNLNTLHWQELDVQPSAPKGTSGPY